MNVDQSTVDPLAFLKALGALFDMKATNELKKQKPPPWISEAFGD